MLTLQQLISEFPQLLSCASSAETKAKVKINTISPIENFAENDIVVCAEKNHLEQISAASHKPAAIIIHAELTKNIPDNIPNDVVLIETNNPRLAQALIKQRLNDYDANDAEWQTPHPTAVISNSASIGKNCRIGPNVVIGENVTIGDNTIIRNNSVIEHDSHIGSNCIIHSLVNIGYATQIGDRVIIRPGAIIGNEGFGLATDENQQHHRLPHTGDVQIADDVQIGANCNIDRGTYGSTVLKRGCKIDALCHIAHNVVLGEDCIITANCIIAGSTVIGDRVIMSGQTGVLDHINIADDVVLVHRAGVISDIDKKGMYGGMPALPFKQHMQRNNLEKSMQKKIAKLEQRLDELVNKSDEN